MDYVNGSLKDYLEEHLKLKKKLVFQFYIYHELLKSIIWTSKNLEEYWKKMGTLSERDW